VGVSLTSVVFTSRNANRDAVIWNSIASLVFGLQSYVLMWLAQLTGGYGDAGVLSFAAAQAFLFWTVGGYSMRRFQVSDVTGRFSFADYCWSRGVTAVVMTAICAGALVVQWHGGAGDFKVAVIALMTTLRLVDVIEDVVYARLQQRSFLYAAGRISAARLITATLAYAVVIVVTGDLVAALVVAIVVSAAILAVALAVVRPKLATGTLGDRARARDVARLLVECFPLFAAGLLLMYLGNAPKYAIEAALPDPDTVQAQFGFLVMPIFVITTISGFIYNPMIVTMATSWRHAELRSLRRLIGRVAAAIVGVTALACVGGYFLGPPVLSFVFHADLHAFAWQFAVLLLGGGLLALSGFVTVVLTVMRRQLVILVVSLAVSLVALATATMWVRQWGLNGACVLAMVIAAVQALCLGAVLTVVLRRAQARMPA
jgi:O-antigen/teichoic acid export membrane protein